MDSQKRTEPIFPFHVFKYKYHMYTSIYKKELLHFLPLFSSLQPFPFLIFHRILMRKQKKELFACTVLFCCCQCMNMNLFIKVLITWMWIDWEKKAVNLLFAIGLRFEFSIHYWTDVWVSIQVLWYVAKDTSACAMNG